MQIVTNYETVIQSIILRKFLDFLKFPLEAGGISYNHKYE